MSSPFPGMDPYLEGYLWQDVHQSLAGQFKRQLNPLLSPRYVAWLAVYIISDLVPGHEIGIVYPDVEVIRPKGRRLAEGGVKVAQPPVTPPTMIVPAKIPLEIRLTSVHVHDVANNELVTAIEILSPANKREPGLSTYREKRTELIAAGVHLLEVDLIRRGQRPWLPEEEMPYSPSLMLLTRGDQHYTELWPVQLSDTLPVLPVPLKNDDSDVPLDVQAALEAIQSESNYHLTIDYGAQPPRPPLTQSEDEWLEIQLSKVGLR
jgi:hypothetical protein